MGFEKAVLGTVATTVGNDHSAGFTNGCLFVQCDEQESDLLLEQFVKNYTGTVIKSGPIQGEYAYDFV